jgi:hypothetical protein
MLIADSTYLNVGVRKNTYWHDYTVNHFFYGVGIDPDGSVHAGVRGGGTQVVATARWAADFHDKDEALRAWQHRDLISEIVARHGGSSDNWSKIPKARLRITFEGDTMTITEFDWNEWQETVTL